MLRIALRVRLRYAPLRMTRKRDCVAIIVTNGRFVNRPYRKSISIPNGIVDMLLTQLDMPSARYVCFANAEQLNLK